MQHITVVFSKVRMHSTQELSRNVSYEFSLQSHFLDVFFCLHRSLQAAEFEKNSNSARTMVQILRCSQQQQHRDTFFGGGELSYRIQSGTHCARNYSALDFLLQLLHYFVLMNRSIVSSEVKSAMYPLLVLIVLCVCSVLCKQKLSKVICQFYARVIMSTWICVIA